MEFLGLESERGLALRIAVVPSGKDNIVRALVRHIRAPQAQQQLKWSSHRVADSTREGNKEAGSRKNKDQLISSCLDVPDQQSLMRNAQHSLM